MNAFNVQQPAAPVFDANLFAVPGAVIPSPEEHAAAVEAERANRPVFKTSYHAEEDETIEYEDEEFEYSSNQEVAQEVNQEVGQDMLLEAPESHANEQKECKAMIEQPEVKDAVEPAAGLVSIRKFGIVPKSGNSKCTWAALKPQINFWLEEGCTATDIMKGLVYVEADTSKHPTLASLRNYISDYRKKKKQAV